MNWGGSEKGGGDINSNTKIRITIIFVCTCIIINFFCENKKNTCSISLIRQTSNVKSTIALKHYTFSTCNHYTVDTHVTIQVQCLIYVLHIVFTFWLSL